jgi:hypothetical protein
MVSGYAAPAIAAPASAAAVMKLANIVMYHIFDDIQYNKHQK